MPLLERPFLLLVFLYRTESVVISWVHSHSQVRAESMSVNFALISRRSHKIN